MIVDRTTAPKTTLDTKIPFIQPEELILDNGLKVYLLHGGTEDIVKLELVFWGGSFNQQAPLVAFSTANLLRTGTSSRKSDEINEAFDFYGAYFHAEAQKDISSFSIFALQRHFESVLELFQEVIKRPIFPEHELHIFLNNQKQQFLVNNRKVQYIARTYFNELLFGQNHPYGNRLKAEDFDGLSQQDLLAFYRDYYHPGNCFCVVSGKLPANIGDLLNVALGSHDWKAVEPVSTPKYMATSASEKTVFVEKPDAVQSAIRIGRRLFNRTHPDHHRLSIANALLGGYFGSRLMQNIRQEKGYTYGVGSNLVSLIRDGYFFIGTETGVDVCQNAVDEIFKELRRLRCIPASESELNRLTTYLWGDFLRSFDGPFAQSQRFKELLAFQLDKSHYDKFLEELKTITAHQIMQTAEKYLHEDSMIELVVGRK